MHVEQPNLAHYGMIDDLALHHVSLLLLTLDHLPNEKAREIDSKEIMHRGRILYILKENH